MTIVIQCECFIAVGISYKEIFESFMPKFFLTGLVIMQNTFSLNTHCILNNNLAYRFIHLFP